MSEQSEKRVIDIMIPVRNYKVVSHNCTVADAIKVLHRGFYQRNAGGQGHRSVIVSDDYGNPQGMVTFRSVLQALEPFFARADRLSVPTFWEGLFTERCKHEAQKSIKDIMHPINVIALDANDTLIKAVHAMIKHKLGTLPVKKNNRLVGMVRVNELFAEVYDLVAGARSMEVSNGYKIDI
ncbi:HPP family protein [Desulfallas thermosapovorans]|uniref:CBS domain protein n=1 Tax=Desulfallas thermosapovorans DSM 6562 TaxID=1121431 RepID=A0A5S4ZWF1_9FIRM|nr:CBS domain-containing protein [Desulfallas thermosapovorans]TYO97327.1 CBS domain protein [Desulfallas thermosapovorans DSM 6562]